MDARETSAQRITADPSGGDVTNLVMLELGQPLHGFDLDTLDGGLIVRMARDGETLTLLDERVIELDSDMLVIADHAGPRALTRRP